MSPKIKSAIVKTPQQPGKRRRVKKLHKDLLEQLEFYLSEASLRHDSFLREKAGERGMECVPIHVFLTFPLIQEMKVDKKNIITAVGNSRILQISKDKNYIQRIFPITRPPHNLDRSTLYMENLPPDATIEWVKEVCKKVGAVRHISLPRYKKSGAIKGFAFVEFATPEDVARACRIFKDPPIHFYPNRAEKYLKYLNRVKMRENMIDSALETSPMLQGEVKNTPPSAEYGLLSRSLDSALDFELVEDDEVATSSSRKRKRRSRTSSDMLMINREKSDQPDDGVSTHTPAKKLKSLPTQLQYKDCATNKKDCATTKNDHSITFSENYSETDTVSMTTTKKRTSGRKVLFSINDENSDNITKTDKFCQNCSNKSLDSENGILEQNGIPCDVKFEIQRNNVEKHCHKQCNTEEEIIDDNETFKSNISGIEEENLEGVTENPTSLKRRRSCSEPPNIFDFAPVTEAKRMKADVATTSDQPITSSQKDTAHVDQPITSLDIDAIITQGRKQAQETIRQDDSHSKGFLHSVVAKPEAKPSKKRKKSRKSSKKDKLSTRQTPPQLIAMPKIQWLDMKKEYKHLQKYNMSRLKNTLRECKDAGSVFIKKHLDVLKDVNISNDSINSFESGDETNNDEQRDKKNNKRGPPTFKPGVIVRISAIESDTNNNKLPAISEIKSRLNKYGQGVAYVDANTSESYGFVRFNDGDSAQRAIMEEKSLALCLLTGEAEERYWDKLLAARARKFARERPKIRGRTKILIKAEGLVEKAKRRHIRFDNDFVV